MKIKKLAIFAMAITSLATTSLAQQSQLPKALYGTPDKYQGYLVFDAVNNPDVAFWVADIYQVIEENDSTKTVEQIDKIGLKESSYLKIDSKYASLGHTITYVISGFNSSGVIIAEDQWDFVPTGQKYFKEVCGSTCDGKTYAYRVVIGGEFQDNVATNQNGHKVELVGVSQTINTDTWVYTPYYRNMTQTEKDNMCQNGGYQNSNSHLNWNSPKHYGQIQCAYPDGVQMIRLTAGQLPHGLKDMNGYTISNEAVRYRIPKTRGYWSEESSSTNYNYHNPAILAEDMCGQLGSSGNIATVGFTNYANQVLNLDNPLTCDGFFVTGTGVGNSQPKPDTVYIEGLPWDNKPKDYYTIISELFVDWVNDNGAPLPITGNSTGVSWWPSDSLVAVQIYKIDVDHNNIPEGPLFGITRDNLFNPNGEPNVPNIVLEKGLYNLLLSFEDGRTFPMIFNVAEEMNNNYELSNYLSVNIFPVPITESGTYSIDFEASATLKFNYFVYDEYGNQVFDRNFVLHKGHERTVKINSNNLPSGILFHKFVFEDNSEINMTTIKN